MFSFSQSTLHFLSETGNKAITEQGAQVESRRGAPWGRGMEVLGDIKWAVFPSCGRIRESSHMDLGSDMRLCSGC